MKYDIERLETMGFKPGRDLCVVRVRPDDWDRVDEFLIRGDFPYLSCVEEERDEFMEYSVPGYFFSAGGVLRGVAKADRSIIEGFPFKNEDCLMALTYKAAAMGLVYLREKFEETLFNKIREKVFAVLDKKNWKKEINEMHNHFSGVALEKAGTNIDLPEEIVTKAGIKMIERIIKSDALTVYDWNEKETGYREMDVGDFDDFEQDREYLKFTARAKGDPVKRLSIVTSDEENEDLYISWTILRDGTDLEAEDGVKLETWTAHKGRVYNNEGKVYNKETGKFDFPPLKEISKEEWEIINEEMGRTKEEFRQDYLWEK